jgi:hypothetical protein
VTFFNRQVAGKPPAAPSGPHDCKDVHVRAGPIRLSTAEREVTLPLSILLQSTDQRPNNRSDHGNTDNPNDGNENNAGGNGRGGGEEEGSGNSGPIAVTPHRMIRRGGVALSNKPVYCDSPEAAKLFGFNEGEDVYNKLGERVTLLKGALQKPDGYKSILQCSEETLNADQVFKIRNKCVFLIRAYQIALEKLGKNNTRWKKDCCQEAVDQINDIGFVTTINANTLMNWNINFRKHEKFHHPDIYVANNIKPTPALFDYFPQAAADASSFILNHLDHFIVEMLRGKLINKIIPSLKEEIEVVTGAADANIDGNNLLRHYMAKPPSYMTVLPWVHYLGFKQDNFKKSYYIDGHEHPS